LHTSLLPEPEDELELELLDELELELLDELELEEELEPPTIPPLPLWLLQVLVPTHDWLFS